MRVAPAAAPVLLVVALTLAGCSTGADFALLTQFFSASRLRDLTALQKVSTVVFEPARDGVVTSFDIDATTVTGAESRTLLITAPVRLPDGRIEKKRFAVTVQRGLITAISERPAVRSIERPAAASTPPR